MSGRTLARLPLEFYYVSLNAQIWRDRVLSTTAEMDLFLNELMAALESAGYSQADVRAVRAALAEAIHNAIRHGHGDDSTKQVRLHYCVADDCFLAEVQDEGTGFSYTALAGRPGAACRGLALMLRHMTWVEHNESGNCVTLCKYRSQE